MTFGAIEAGLWVVRPVSSGISAVVDPSGQVLAQCYDVPNWSSIDRS